MCFMVSCTEEGRFCDVLTKNLIMAKHSANKLGIFYKANGLCSSTGKDIRKKDGGAVLGYRQLEIKLKW